MRATSCGFNSHPRYLFVFGERCDGSNENYDDEEGAGTLAAGDAADSTGRVVKAPIFLKRS